MKKKQFIDGFVFLDVPAGALNMQGSGPSEGGFPYTEIKQFKTRRGNIPFISGQSWKFWIRKYLENEGWTMSPIEKKEKQVNTQCEPYNYIDDDLFGYMDARNSITRTAAIKVSYLIGYLAVIEKTFNSLSRDKNISPMPFFQDLSYGGYGGIFSVNLSMVGRYTTYESAGFRNLLIDKKKGIPAEIIQDPEEDQTYILKNKEERWRRSKAFLKSINYLYGGAHETLSQVDITPKLIIILHKIGGNNPLGSFISTLNPSEPDPALLLELIEDYKDLFLSNIYIGIRKEAFSNYKQWINLNKQEIQDTNYTIEIATPVQAMNNFIEELEKKKEKLFDFIKS